jgi:hypothetical protein
VVTGSMVALPRQAAQKPAPDRLQAGTGAAAA